MIDKALVYAFGHGDVTALADENYDLEITGNNPDSDIGLRVFVPAGEVVKLGKISVIGCFVNLMKSGDGLLIVGELITRKFGGDNILLLGSGLHIGKVDVAENMPTRSYDDYHQDAIIQMLAVLDDGFKPDPEGEVCNVRLPVVIARIDGDQTQGIIGSEACDYHDIEIGTELFDVKLGGYPFHTVFNSLRDSRIGCVGAKVDGQLKILDVKGAGYKSSDVSLLGIDRCDVVGDVAAVSFCDAVDEVVDVSDQAMRMSNAGLQQLIKSEGSVPYVYHCQAGVPTIGVGYALSQSEVNAGKIYLESGDVIDFRNDREITSDEVMLLLRDCLPKYERAVNVSVNVPIDQDNFDALVHFAFNVGVGAFSRSTLVKRLNAMSYDDVPAEIMKWKYVTVGGKKQVSEGLVNRRKKECVMWSPESERDYKSMMGWIESAGSTSQEQSSAGIDLVAAAKALGVGSTIEKVEDGFDKTLEIARKHARNELQAEMDAKRDELRVEAIESFKRSNSQKPMQSRTNRSVVGMVVATGLRVAVATTGLGAVFAEPSVAEAVTGLVVGGLDIAVAGLGVAAIKFRNMATKFVG